MIAPAGRGPRSAGQLVFVCAAALAAALTAGSVPALAGDTARVTVDLPLPPRLDVSAYRKVLVTRLVTSDVPFVDPGREMVSMLRRLLSKTSLTVLEVEPPYLPEQTVEDLLRNSAFWKHLGEEYGADLIVSGEVIFSTKDLSAFVEEDVTSEITGQTVRVTRFAERTGFTLRASLWFFKGANGSLLYEDSFRETQVYEGKNTESLAAFYEIAELMAPQILGVLVATTRPDPRTIFTR